MTHKRILAFSSSRVGNSGFLELAKPVISNFLGGQTLNIAFIPFASADRDYEEYTAMVRTAFNGLPYTVTAVLPQNALKVIAASNVVMVGGGNTFKLLHDIYEHKLLLLIREKVEGGTPYIGWSAGANITGLSIGTTNDMPVIEPESFKAFGFLPFQLNPHYINQVSPGFNGETRDQRLMEFLQMNPGIPIVGLPEGTALLLENGSLIFIGEHQGVLFENGAHGPVKREISALEDLSFLLRAR